MSFIIPNTILRYSVKTYDIYYALYLSVVYIRLSKCKIYISNLNHIHNASIFFYYYITYVLKIWLNYTYFLLWIISRGQILKHNKQVKKHTIV